MISVSMVMAVFRLVAPTALRRIAVLTLWEAAQRTPDTLDDQVVSYVAAALGVSLPAPLKDTLKKT